MGSDGILLINKPKGVTSTKVVEKVRKRLRTKVGHSGTLDPVATGLLVLLIGKATRFSWLFLEMDKAYRVKARLGVRTDTYDAEGNVLEEREVNVSCEEVKDALKNFMGEIQQVPPPFSAKKVKGKRAYKLARKGEKLTLNPVKVKVYELEMLRCDIPVVELFMKVSSGTYVRSLINELGNLLSVGAIVEDLVRESVGPFKLENAYTLEQFMMAENPQDMVTPVDKAFSFLPKVSLNFFSAKRVLNGNPVLLRDAPEGYVAIYVDNIFVGIGSVKSNILKPERLLIPESIQA